MICNYCGAENLDNSRYCCQCAKPFYDIYDGDKETKRKSAWLKLIPIVFCVVVVAGLFFPFLSVKYGIELDMGTSLMDGENGWFILSFAIIGLIHALFNKYIPVCVTGVFSLVMFLYEQREIEKLFKDWSGELLRFFLKHGAGYYLSIVGILGMIVSGIVCFFYYREKSKM